MRTLQPLFPNVIWMNMYLMRFKANGDLELVRLLTLYKANIRSTSLCWICHCSEEHVYGLLTLALLFRFHGRPCNLDLRALSDYIGTTDRYDAHPYTDPWSCSLQSHHQTQKCGSCRAYPTGVQSCCR